MMPNILNGLLPVQSEGEYGTQKVLDLCRGRSVYNASFDVLWSKVGDSGWECCIEARSEHDDELYRLNCARQ